VCEYKSELSPDIPAARLFVSGERDYFSVIFFAKTLRRQPKWLVLLEALALVGLIGGVDYATDWEWSFFVLYALPIVMVTWKTDRRLGFAFAILCTITSWVAEIGNNLYQTHAGFVLAVVGWLFYFVVPVVAAEAVKAQQELDRARIKALEHTQELERDIIWTSEREQQRIGRDLHDSLGSQLAAIGYAATFLADELRQRQQPEAAEAERIREMVGEAISLSRDLAHGIFPVQMGGVGLSIALEDLARTTSTQRGISVSFHETGDAHVESAEGGMHLYRIAQEAVNNAAKHGGARKITIVLSRSEDSLRLAVADDGKGMAPPPDGTRGMGLHSMRYRARALEGELKIDSDPSEGTIVSCEIPNRPAPPPTAAS
jgi:signal transduction histidine kinase